MRKFVINVNGKAYEVEVEEVGGAPSAAPVAAPVAASPAAPAAAPAAPAAAPAAPAAAPAGSTVVKAPMPGTILRIDAKVGENVKKGDVLLILEAMKMENEIVAPCDGVVKSVMVSNGASVNTDDQLVALG